ncbi:hypothetical protein SAMN05216516_10348 [Izhakiella capsodis]|uniref:Uncharacterized protein n=1 Tax=Izhakiella capsodis TaxID=1367852 RepID=A0A1I4WSG4_9GAMM|nr:hypothetical protein [Izhakiella capsodis]SFN16781.1 hypothetical protein SAMN05216516_10348 [Izhakiella capsodis]
MKRNMIYLVLLVSTLFTSGQSVAEAGVNKVGGTWILSPVSWHPDLNKEHADYPFDLTPINTGSSHQLAKQNRKHQQHNTSNKTSFVG